MTLNNPFMGPGDVPSYQMSAIPFLTSSAATEVPLSGTPIKVTFPNVTRFVVVTPLSANPLRVGVTAKGVLGEGASVSGSAHESTPDHANYFIVTAATSRLEIRTKELFFMSHSGGAGGFSLLAGITPIKASMFPTLTGSAGYIGVG